ncbi:hypothetical protein ACFRDV_22325 [Streptomyces fagopyri]|uniref:hypothetical protein n=1 Tax=Streptomyces fagopyri TaxID=2662397 RepID=UPI003679184A
MPETITLPTPEQLDQIEARAKAIPEGPWREVIDPMSLSRMVASADDLLYLCLGSAGNPTQAVAEFLVNAIEDVPTLVPAVRHLMSRVTELEAALQHRESPADDTAVLFDGSHSSVLAVMRLADVGRTITEIRIHADSDPAKAHITIPMPDGSVRVCAGDWIVRDPDGSFRTHGPCPAALLAIGDGASEKCVERPPHRTHKNAAGECWTDDVHTEEREAPGRTEFQDRVYATLAAFNAVAEWPVLKTAKMRQQLAEHLTDELRPPLPDAHTAAAAYPLTVSFVVERYDPEQKRWGALGYPQASLVMAQLKRDNRRARGSEQILRIVEWTESARVIESDEVPADAEAVQA